MFSRYRVTWHLVDQITEVLILNKSKIHLSYSKQKKIKDHLFNNLSIITILDKALFLPKVKTFFIFRLPPTKS